MLTYKIVDIRRSELCIIRKEVAAWELPILQAMHEGVTEMGEKLVNRPTPTAEAEFQRLTALYKDSIADNGDKGIPYVAAVYGQFNVGVNALRRAITDAVVETDEVESLL